MPVTTNLYLCTYILIYLYNKLLHLSVNIVKWQCHLISFFHLQGIKKSADAAGMGRHSQAELEALVTSALRVFTFFPYV